MAVIGRPGKRVKAFAAIVGGSAMVALGAVGVFTGGGSTGGPPVVMSVGQMTMGDTETASYSETMVTSAAVPADKATPPCGFNSGC